MTAPPLSPLPAQPADVPWPGSGWHTGRVPPGVDLAPLVDAVFEDDGRYGTTFAVVVVHRGRLVAERYGGALEHWDRPSEPVGPDTPLLSWSMAKSVLHAVVGLLVDEGRLALHAPSPVARWHRDPGDGRATITLEHLLTFRDGLAFREDYVDGRASDVIEMLFGTGGDDVARFAADRPLTHPPGDVFCYSSGTSNIVAGILGDTLAGATAPADRRRAVTDAFLHEHLFAPIGMTSARVGFDEAGTWVASSYLHATARDFARFGLLALRGGTWDGRAVLPPGWIDHGRTPRSVDPENGWVHGAHWWIVDDGGFWANGYQGQSILCEPDLDLVLVRLGRTDASHAADLQAWRAAVADTFRSPVRGDP